MDTKLVPLQDNIELQGALLATGVAGLWYLRSRDLGDSLAVGSLVGATTVAAVKTFGRPKIVQSILKQ